MRLILIQFQDFTSKIANLPFVTLSANLSGFAYWLLRLF